jgi:MFS family permease
MNLQNINPWRGLKGLPHDMWALFVTTLINRSGTMVIPFLTLYLTQKINATPAQAGTALLVYGAAAFVSSPIMGKLADKIGALRVMKYSLFGTGIMYFIFSLTENYYLILLFSLLLSITNEAFRPANLSMITETVTPPQRRMAFTLNRLGINIGMSIGPVIGGFLTMLDYHLLFYANAITSIAAGVYLVNTNWSSAEPSGSEDKMLPDTILPVIRKSVFSDRNFMFFLAAIVPVNLVFFQILGVLPLYVVQDLGYTTAAFGIFAAINTVLIIFAEVPLNDYMTRISYKKSLIIGAVFTAVGFGATAFARDTLPLVITILLWTVGEMIFFPVSAAYASETAPENRRGEYMGYYQMTFSFAFSAGPWVGTVIYQNFDAYTLWLGTFFFGMISTVMLFFLRKIEPVIQK